MGVVQTSSGLRAGQKGAGVEMSFFLHACCPLDVPILSVCVFTPIPRILREIC